MLMGMEGYSQGRREACGDGRILVGMKEHLWGGIDVHGDGGMLMRRN